MNLDELNDKNFSKLDSALKGIFGMNFNFKADTSKLEKIREATMAKIERFRDTGVEVTDKSFQKLLLVKEGLDQELRFNANLQAIGDEFGAIGLQSKGLTNNVLASQIQVNKLGKLSFVGIEGEEAEVDKFCNNDNCEIPGEEIKST